MAEIDAFGKAGCSSCIESRGACVLVEIVKYKIRRAGGEYTLVRVGKSWWYRELVRVVD